MKEIDYTVPIFVSGTFTMLLLVFYLYKSENNAIMRFLSSRFIKTRHERAEIKKDTRSHDAMLLTVLVILILAFGLKTLSFAVVVSDSMKPEFQRGDLVLTQSLFKDPHVGDIITFKARDVQYAVTHRVVNVKDDIVTTKGDNNPLADDYGTTKGDVLGKAIVIDSHPVAIPSVGSYFILDFSREGKLYKFGDQYAVLQQMFLTIRTWGYVITIIAFAMLLMSMSGNRK
jgi:signal peptidase I